MPRIASVESRTVEVPLPKPTRIATRQLPSRTYTLVRVRTEDGVDGVGFCLGGKASSFFIREILGPSLRGGELFEGERFWDWAYRTLLLQGRRGAAVRALSAVDIALWDARAKAAGVPLARLIGGFRDKVPAYASGGYYVEGKGVRELVEEVTGYVEQGFRAVKIKVGGVDLDEDVRRVEAVREALGNSVLLMLDANNAWRDSYSALKAVRRFEEFDIEWIEEPLSPDDIDGHRLLRQKLETAVATGEIEATRWGFVPLIEGEAADVIQADASVCGGITEWLKIAHIAEAHGVPVAPHWFSDLHVHCAAAVPNGAWVEVFVGHEILNIGLLYEGGAEVANGYAVVPQRPGIGLEWSEKVIERYALDEWS